jgi:uncharacterized protein with PIN domain
MGRILKAYETRFRSMLKQAGARRPEQGAEWLVARARRQSAATDLPLYAALTQAYQRLQRQVLSPRRRGLAFPILGAIAPEFWCDSGLGGLCRWLRAAGYDALWDPCIEDGELVQRARSDGRVLLTTDSLLMERRLVRDRVVLALWLPPTLTIPEQMRLAIDEFHLSLRESRCMACGGQLRRVPKESLRERIPPKTWRWLDEYFVCTRCDQLFWRGTHWHRIRNGLEEFFQDRRPGKGET